MRRVIPSSTSEIYSATVIYFSTKDGGDCSDKDADDIEMSY